MEEYVWRFGYGSNIGRETLEKKKNLNLSRYLVGSIQGWELYFMKGIPYVEPGWAAIRSSADEATKLHGSAFLIPKEEAIGLDRQEGGYNILPSRFVSYDGEVIEGVGLYVPKKQRQKGEEGEDGTPSLRYLRLLQNGARDAGLCKEWIQHLDSIKYYVTPPDVRSQTNKWIAEFHTDPTRKDVMWTAEELSKFDGRSDTVNFPAHTAVMGYVVKLATDMRVFPSWKGHTITRRNLLQFNGKSLDTNDIRFGQPGFRPLPNLGKCSDEEKEFVMQNLESLLHRGCIIVGQLKDFLEDQDE